MLLVTYQWEDLCMERVVFIVVFIAMSQHNTPTCVQVHCTALITQTHTPTHRLVSSHLRPRAVEGRGAKEVEAPPSATRGYARSGVAAVGGEGRVPVAVGVLPGSHRIVREPSVEVHVVEPLRRTPRGEVVVGRAPHLEGYIPAVGFRVEAGHALGGTARRRKSMRGSVCEERSEYWFRCGYRYGGPM